MPGWDQVDQLAAVLVEHGDRLSLTALQADRIRRLWGQLEELDRRPLQFGGVPRRTSVRGRFQRRYRPGGHVGVEAVGRSVIDTSCCCFNVPSLMLSAGDVCLCMNYVFVCLSD